MDLLLFREGMRLIVLQSIGMDLLLFRVGVGLIVFRVGMRLDGV